MILFLPGLKFLALIDLLDLKLLLPLLVFLVLLGIARVWSRRASRGRKIPGMDCGTRASGLGGRTSSFGGFSRSFVVRASGVVLGGGCGMNSSTFSGGYSSALFKGAGLRSSSDGRLAVIGGGA